MNLQKIKVIGYSSLLAIILITVDIICFSRSPFKIGDKDYQNLNMALYIYSAILSQITYNMFSNINTAIISGPIVENFQNINDLIKNIQKQLKTDDENMIISNTFMCLTVVTLLFGIMSILLSKLNGEYYLKKIPNPVITGSLCAIGVLFVLSVFNDYSENSIRIFSVVTSLITFWIKQRYNHNLILPACIFAFFTLFYILRPFFYLLKSDYWLESSEYTILHPKILIEHLNFSLLDPKLIIKNFLQILSISGYSMIHIIVNLPIFSQITGCGFRFTKELMAQGLTNIFTSTIAMPCYFVACYSIAINKTGGNNRIYGIIIAIAYTILPFIVGFIQNLLPKFIIAMLPMVFGYDFLYYGIEEIKNGDNFDFFVIAFTFFVNIMAQSYQIIGVILGSIVYYAGKKFLNHRNRIVNQDKKV
ncbi:hypothetical protein DMUE_4874 [Dictyocoela muelleri]|nr:hypothetical protein DMUE_4874 [Dictyocoela muelleri]